MEDGNGFTDEDTEAAALAAQQQLEHEQFLEEAQKALQDDAEAYHQWLDELFRQGIAEGFYA